MPARGRYFYGYAAVAGGFAAYFVVVGSYFGLTVLVSAMAQDMGWTSAQFGLGFTCYLLTGLAAPLYGAAIQRWGPRASMTAGALLSALGWLGMALTRGLAGFCAAALVLGAGMYLGSMMPLAQLVGNWFGRRRTLVMGLALTAGGFGGLAFANLAPLLSAALGGWRGAWLAHALLMLAGAAVAALLVRDRPQDMGQAMDGGAPGAPQRAGGAAPAQRGDRSSPPRQWGVADALRTPAFWSVTAGMACGGFLMMGLQAHQVSYLVGELEVAPAAAGAIVGLASLFSIAGRVGSGWLGSRIPPRSAFTIGLALMAAAAALLRLVPSRAVVPVYAGLLGLGMGALVILPSVLMMDYYGTHLYPRLFGIASGIVCVAESSSSFIIGALRDARSSYLPAFTILALIGLAAAALVMLAPPPGEPAARRPSGERSPTL